MQKTGRCRTRTCDLYISHVKKQDVPIAFLVNTAVSSVLGVGLGSSWCAFLLVMKLHEVHTAVLTDDEDLIVVRS